MLEGQGRVFGEGSHARCQRDGEAHRVLARISPVAIRKRLPGVSKGRGNHENGTAGHEKAVGFVVETRVSGEGISGLTRTRR